VQYHRNYDPYLVLLADKANLKSIHEAPVLIMDGTFDYRPTGSAQTYTIHSVFPELPDRQSSFLSGKLIIYFYLINFLGIAFLPNKVTETYKEVFSELRISLVDSFGNVGGPKLVIMDCELAAHNAIEEVFPEFRVRSCFFHFTKNVLDKAKSIGLSELLKNADFSRWLTELLGKFS
jgi:hypothetical protein